MAMGGILHELVVDVPRQRGWWMCVGDRGFGTLGANGGSAPQFRNIANTFFPQNLALCHIMKIETFYANVEAAASVVGAKMDKASAKSAGFHPAGERACSRKLHRNL